MAASLNKVFLMGNLTRDPDLRFLPSGQAVCEVGLAVNRRYLGSNGQEVEEPCFVDVVIWGKTAENVKQYLEKGSQVLVEGRLQLDQWEDRNGGGKRSRLRVVSEQIQFLSRRGGNTGSDGDNGPGAYDNSNYGGGGNYQQPQQPQQQRPAGNQPPQQPRSNYPNQGASMPQRPVRTPLSRPAENMPPLPPDGAFDPNSNEDDIPF